MINSNNRTSKKHWLLTLSWLLLVLFGFIYFTKARLVPFDPVGSLTHLKSHQIASFISNGSKLMLTEHKQTIFHFLSPDCHCNNLNTEHIILINKMANMLNYKVKNINLTQSDIIPSAPAILVIDEQGEVLYLGPYSQGLTCSPNTSFVETVLNNAKSGFNSALIVSHAQGCYCPLEKNNSKTPITISI